MEDILLLKSQITQGQTRRDMGIDPPIYEYDLPSSLKPGLNNPNSPRDDFFAQQFGPLAGEYSRKLDEGVSAVPNVLSAVLGLDLVKDGAENLAQGTHKGDLLRAAGGISEIALATLPLSGRALSAAYRTIPRAMGTGAAYGVSPLVAAGVFSPEDAQAGEEGNYFEQMARATEENGADVLAGAMASVLPVIGLKGMVKANALNAQKNMADIERVGTNRVAAESALRLSDDPNLQYHIREDLKKIEPTYYHSKTIGDLEDDLYRASEKAQGVDDIDTIGMLAGGAVAGGADVLYHQDDEASLGRTVGNVALGALVGRALPPAYRGDRKPAIESKIKPFYTGETIDRLPAPVQSPISTQYNKKTRGTIERKLREGHPISGLSNQYGVSVRTLGRWKDKLDR